VAIPLSGQQLVAGPGANSSESVVVYGIAPSVPPGTHTVALEVSSGANVALLGFGADEQVEAIAMKG